MMNVTFLIVGLILLFASFVGCVLPVVPGPVLALCGLGALYFTDHEPGAVVMCSAAVVVVVSSFLDYVVPAISAKKFKCSKAGVWGCMVGSFVGFVLGTLASFSLSPIVGAFVLLLGLLTGPFVGTMAGEMLAHRSFGEAFNGGVGALVGYMVAVGLKLVACLVVTIQFFWVWLSAH